VSGPVAPAGAGRLPWVALASLGLPGLNGFISEFLVVRGSWPIFPVFTAVAMLGLLLTGAYVLKAIQKVLHGPVNARWKETALEIAPREVVVIAPLVVLMLVIGIWPTWLLNVINAAVSRLFG